MLHLAAHTKRIHAFMVNSPWKGFLRSLRTQNHILTTIFFRHPCRRVNPHAHINRENDANRPLLVTASFRGVEREQPITREMLVGKLTAFLPPRFPIVVLLIPPELQISCTSCSTPSTRGGIPPQASRLRWGQTRRISCRQGGLLTHSYPVLIADTPHYVFPS